VNINDRVAQISTTIQELRQASADGRRSRQLLDSLFRTVHTFKAAAAAEGLTHLSRTAHEFEDLLHALRTGKLTLDDELLRVCDETVVALREGTQASTLNSFTDATRHTPTGDDAQLPAEFDSRQEFASLKDDERHRAAAALREGANLYVMNVEFEVSDFDERFRQLKERLDESAELISTSATMRDDKVLFQVVYAGDTEKIPVQTVLQQAARAGYAIAATLGKQIDFVMKSEGLLLDKSLADVLADALLHLVRNAVDHGIEAQGKVTLATQTSAETTRVFVTDNGRGIDEAHLPLLFQPGFSTATEVSETSGRGVGLDAVKTGIEAIGGTVNVISYPGKFTSFVIKLPSPSSDA
jgi:two-component system chemotaxis sensor kinase CheA